MAMEYYANPSIPLKRIFPIFFGNRNDVFGKIGNLFVDPSYKSLPSTQPMASIQLAARLLRENGIEPRPEMFEITAAGIVENMKKFLCIFAWNISNPDFLTTECVNQIQQVLQSSLADADTTPAAISRHDPNIPVAEANVAGKGALSLPRSIEILREQLGIEVTAVAAVVGEALKVLGDDELEARSSGIKSLAKRAEFIVREGLCYAGE